MEYFIIDVREPHEYADGHVEGAVNIPPSSLMTGPKELKGISKDTAVIVYCRTGSRSNVALHILKEFGYTNVTNGISKEQVKAKYDL